MLPETLFLFIWSPCPLVHVLCQLQVLVLYSSVIPLIVYIQIFSSKIYVLL